MKEAMQWLASKPETLFLGQGVLAGGTHMSKDFADIDPEKRIEFPVAEDLQMGVSTGLALEGFVPVSVYPRWNFLMLAANQLVQHLDRLPLMSGYKPKVLIRTAVGSSSPLDPGHQHKDDYTDTFRGLLKTVRVWSNATAADWKRAYDVAVPVLLVDPMG